jgi:hypothetical protein
MCAFVVVSISWRFRMLMRTRIIHGLLVLATGFLLGAAPRAAFDEEEPEQCEGCDYDFDVSCVAWWSGGSPSPSNALLFIQYVHPFPVLTDGTCGCPEGACVPTDDCWIAGRFQMKSDRWDRVRHNESWWSVPNEVWYEITDPNAEYAFILNSSCSSSEVETFEFIDDGWLDAYHVTIFFEMACGGCAGPCD